MGWATGLLTTVLSSLLRDMFSVRVLMAKLKSELLWCGALVRHADGLGMLPSPCSTVGAHSQLRVELRSRVDL